MNPHLAAAAVLLILGISSHSTLAQDVTARNLAANCATCHGTNGNSAGGIPPSLAGRDRNEIVQTMKAFQAGKRPATIMHQHAKGYTDRDLELIAGYFAAQKPAAARMPSKP